MTFTALSLKTKDENTKRDSTTPWVAVLLGVLLV
jgi:hypothetical protein